MAYPAWPKEAEFIVRDLEPAMIVAPKINGRKLRRSLDGFRGMTSFTDAQWEIFERIGHGLHRLKLPNGQENLVQVMGINSLYPGHEPFVATINIRPGEDSTRVIRYWLVNHGPLGSSIPDPESGLAT